MKNLAKLGVDIVNVHCAGGITMMKAAIEGLNEGAIDGKRPLCIGVTQLTSTSKEAMNERIRDSRRSHGLCYSIMPRMPKKPD